MAGSGDGGAELERIAEQANADGRAIVTALLGGDRLLAGTMSGTVVNPDVVAFGLACTLAGLLRQWAEEDGGGPVLAVEYWRAFCCRQSFVE